MCTIGWLPVVWLCTLPSRLPAVLVLASRQVYVVVPRRRRSIATLWSGSAPLMLLWGALVCPDHLFSIPWYRSPSYLDGERQSLVYNHHTDLVAASETIAKVRLEKMQAKRHRLIRLFWQMKTHADSLDNTLTGLNQSFDSMRKLEAQLGAALRPVIVSLNGNDAAAAATQQWTREVIVPVATLPQRLRHIIALATPRDDGNLATETTELPESMRNPTKQGLAAAEALWGRHEGILSTWAQEGVRGAESVASECRAILKEAREAEITQQPRLA